MRVWAASMALIVAVAAPAGARKVDYASLWTAATPFHQFLEGVKARAEQWQSRFANAAIEPDALTEARALPAKRQILVVAEDRCSDSAWAVPYLAKLAAAVPEKLELRVIAPKDGGRIQAAHLTPDGRMATPTVAVLDENGRFIGAWIERPAELQKWYLANKSMDQGPRYEKVSGWYTEDAGRSTIREVLAIARRTAAEGK